MSVGNEDVKYPVTPAEEMDTISGIFEASVAQVKEGDTFFLITSRWLKQWVDYVWEGSPQRPSSIDNSDLVIQPNGENDIELRETLLENHDYMLLPEQAWVALQKWYGGGPPVARKVINTNSIHDDSLFVEVYPHRLSLSPNESQLTNEEEREHEYSAEGSSNCTLVCQPSNNTSYDKPPLPLHLHLKNHLSDMRHNMDRLLLCSIKNAVLERLHSFLLALHVEEESLHKQLEKLTKDEEEEARKLHANFDTQTENLLEVVKKLEEERDEEMRKLSNQLVAYGKKVQNLECKKDEEVQKLRADLVSKNQILMEEVEMLKQENQASQVEMRELREKLEEEKEKAICCVCLEKPRDTVLMPCMHFQFCLSCVLRHRQCETGDLCPTCRQKVEGFSWLSTT